MKVLALEFYKLRRKRIALMMTIFLTIELIWIFMSMSIYMSRNSGSVSWPSIIVMAASVNGLFLPVMCAIAVSRISDMEHKGNTWKLLIATSVKRSQLYLAKYICANTVLLSYVLVQAVAIAGFGIINGFDGSLPLPLMVYFIGGAVLTNLAVTALQLWVSLAVKNQAFALCLGMIGGFVGMTAGLFPAPIRRVFAWSYYSELSPVGIVYTGPTVEYSFQYASAGLLTGIWLMTIIFFAAGSIHVTRQQI
ncbi:ABC transporter permease [Paenibacillus alba]|uniref:ABC transporter permease n=1 Tax=Paenibacillus alba TaxID=1197127 RepID=UPI0015654D07|nr:ABC transporter permease [Paenibacillus alba]NQX70668.1 ABC transporter permease [Paenibacillus alba]